LDLLCTSEEKPKTKGKKKEADLQTSTSIKSSERKSTHMQARE
jgi:hypothetical protein